MATIDLESELELVSSTNKQQPKQILNNKTNQVAAPSINNQQYNKKVPVKDSLGDIDDMISDFEKKYTDSSNNGAGGKATDPFRANNAANMSIPKANMNMGNQKPANVIKTPVMNGNKRNSIVQPNSTNNNNIKDALLAQFKDDPVFGDLLQSNKNQPNNLSGTNLQANRRNSNFGVPNDNKMDSNMQKKKFEDMFNNLDNGKAGTGGKVDTKKPLANQHNFLDDILFDDENTFKQGGNKKPVMNPINSQNKNAAHADLSNEANARRRLINKSARKDILEEIFGDDLFNSISSKTNANNPNPANSKAVPQMAKRNSITNNTLTNMNTTTNNKYDEIFAANNGSNQTKNQKDPFDFGLDYEPSFLKDDPTNQYNTRRSRYLPSGKRVDSNNSAKGGWNQTQFKIAVNNNININGTRLDSGKQNANNSYVPSFVGSGKSNEKKSKCLFVRDWSLRVFYLVDFFFSLVISLFFHCIFLICLFKYSIS